MASKFAQKRIVLSAIALALSAALLGCDGLKDIGDYLNLRNSFLDPSQVGRFDKASPYDILGKAKPVTWPILSELDVLDETNEHFANATDPLPSDLISDTKEYTIGEGDLLRVSVFALLAPGLEYFKEVKVNELGDISIQNINRVHVAGLTPTQLEEKIGQIAVDRGFLLPKGNGDPGPQVSVTLLQSQSRVFSVIGQSTPGTYSIYQVDFRLLDALALAHDIPGAGQPGLDYLYVIRPQKGAGVIPAGTTPEAAPTTGPAGAGPSSPASNPLNAIDSIEKGTSTQPATQPKPGAEGPEFLRPLPMAVVMPGNNPTQLAQADLDAALGSRPAVATSQPATTPAADAAAAPAAPAAGGDTMLNQAVGGSADRPGYIFVDGKWVLVNGPTPASQTAQPGQPGQPAMSPAENVAAAGGLAFPRVIRIPIDALREGNPKYNIVIRPGDIINVPGIEPGEFYMIGHVGRPGVFSLTGRKVTLKQAVAAAGGLDSVAIPRRCDLIRRIGDNQEVTVQVDLQRIFDGEQPDIFLKANDVINVGTDMFAPFLAVTRNAYRATYGWGFTYDRNLYNQVALTQSVPAH